MLNEEKIRLMADLAVFEKRTAAGCRRLPVTSKVIISAGT